MAISSDLLQMELYIVTGDIPKLEKKLSDILESSGCKLNGLIWKSDNSTILHMASWAGQIEMMSKIVDMDPDIFFCRNEKGNLPIHVAVKAGQKDAVRALIDIEENNEQIQSTGQTQLEMINDNNDTALHIALQNGFKDLADYLFRKNSNTGHFLNKMQMSPLYMAIEAGYIELAQSMVREISVAEDSTDLMNRRYSVVHAAIMARNRDILDTLISKYPETRYTIDEKGRTMLSYAAQIGFLDGVTYILEKHPELAVFNDEDGSYPIHRACGCGKLRIVKKLYSSFPNMKSVLNQKDQNILHIAAGTGHDAIVRYLLGRKTNGMKSYVNVKDFKGNTPLHLATLGKHPRVVYELTTCENIDLKALNNQQFTALDVAEENDEEPTFDERLTWTALLSANVPRSTSVPTGAKMLNKTHKITTLLILCSLVATVSFTATFAMPGGYSSGVATLAHKAALQAFILSNTIAMFSSVFSAVILIWAHFDDLSLFSLNLSVLFLCLALTMMSIAFITGLYVVLYNVCNWLAIMVIVTGSLFLMAILVCLIPLYSLTSDQIKNTYVRYIFHFFFKLTLLICSRSGSVDET